MYMTLLLHPSYSYLLDCSIASIVGCTFRDAYMMTMLSLHDSLCPAVPGAFDVCICPQPRCEARRRDAGAERRWTGRRNIWRD
jgi:hypothetical protein